MFSGTLPSLLDLLIKLFICWTIYEGVHFLDAFSIRTQHSEENKKFSATNILCWLCYFSLIILHTKAYFFLDAGTFALSSDTEEKKVFSN